MAEYADADGLRARASRSPTPTRPVRPADARGGRLPGGRQPREPKLAAIARKRGWHVEHWSQGARRPAQARCSRIGAARRSRADGPHEGAGVRAVAPPVRRGRGRRSTLRAGRAAPRSGRSRSPTSTRPTCPAPAGCACGRAWPASAAPTWPPIDGAVVALLRADRQLPVRARPRGRRRARRRHAASWSSRCCTARPAASTRSCDQCAAGQTEPVRAHRVRPPRARAADRLLRADTGGGWSTRSSPTRASCTTCPTTLTDEAAVMVEPAACAVHAARPLSATATSRSSAPARSACCTIAALRHFGTPDVRSSPPPSTRSSATWPRDSAPTSSSSPTSSTAAVRRADRLAGGRRPAHRRRRRRRRLRRQRATRCAGARVVAPGGTVVLVGMPGRRQRRPHAALAPRGDAARRVRVHAATTSPRVRAGRRPRARPAGVGHSTRSPATARPSSTPPRPAAAAP